MNSNPLYGLRKVGTLVQLTGTAWPGRCTSLCLQAARSGWVSGGRLWSVIDGSALEACTIRDDALYKLMILIFYL